MEYTEPWNAQDNEAQQRIPQLEEMLCKHFNVVKYPIYQRTAESDYGTVNQEYAPIGQRIFSKIPIKYLIKRISHISSFF